MLTDQVRQQISAFIEEEFPEVYIVDLELGEGGKRKLNLRIDTDSGIPLNLCVQVARDLGPWLDEEDLIHGEYGLQVSSPGLDEPLKLLRQYKKNIDRDLRILLENGEILIGKLIEVDGESLVICTYIKPKKVIKGRKPKLSDEKIKIELNQIKEAKIKV